MTTCRYICIILYNYSCGKYNSIKKVCCDGAGIIGNIIFDNFTNISEYYLQLHHFCKWYKWDKQKNRNFKFVGNYQIFYFRIPKLMQKKLKR